MKQSETMRLDASAAALNEARITVVEFLSELEARQRLSIPSAVVTLQRALRQYAQAVALLEQGAIESVIQTYYDSTKEGAAAEKRLVTQMFEAVLMQNVSAFNRYYQAYVKSLL